MLFSGLIPASPSYDVEYGVESFMCDNLKVLRRAQDNFTHEWIGTHEFIVPKLCEIDAEHESYTIRDDWEFEEGGRALCHL